MPANQDIFDAQLRHEIAVRRFTAREVRQALEILDRANKDLRAQLAVRLVEGETTTTLRFKEMLKDIRVLRKELFKKLRQTNRKSMVDLAKMEQKFTKQIVELNLPVQLDLNTVSAGQLNALVKTKPFAGGANSARTLQKWWKGLEAADATRITESLQLGVVQGESIQQIASRVNGVVGLTRANAEAVVRTAVNHTVNTSREAFFNANSDIVSALRWTATLDGRTSAICRARDGHFAPLSGNPEGKVPSPLLDPPGARPPAHPSCRSLMTTVLSPEGIADIMPPKPFVRDARTRKFRERDFRKEARLNVGAKKWKRMSVSQRNGLIKKNRLSWAQKNIGQVPGKTNYDQWLRRQPAKFQNEVLGIGKGKMFRKGLKLDQFVDRKGKEFTLDELSEQFPNFAAAT